MDIPKYFHLWAKSEGSQVPDVHPLIYHMLDVGECVLCLWNYALSNQTRQMFAGYLDLDLEMTGRKLAFWASLHDLGKASPGFQRKYPPRISGLEKVGFVFPQVISPHPAPHGILSAWALKDLLQQDVAFTKRDAQLIALALGGHHGAWPTNDRFSPVSLKSSDKGNESWNEARKQLFQTLKWVYHPADSVKLPLKQKELNSFLMLFSGLVSVADWIGSMSENFPFYESYLPANEYSLLAADRAKASLEKLGWLGWKADGALLTFAAMFPDILTPNQIQEKTIEAAGCDLPALAILEAPTGIGKTEAALFLADTWLQRLSGSGLYIAMPTQATSNQMYDRVVSFLGSRYPFKSINTHLVHGAALLEDNNFPQPRGIAQDDQTFEGSIKAEAWFLPRKRTLLAPFGVGTVDQALMSVLQTNHFFVRMFGLGQKVVVFDEIHSYDVYMSTLFERLLRWLHSIGASVILLSATLPEQTRRELARAWLGNSQAFVPTAKYPRLTIASAGKIDARALPSPLSRPLQVDWVDLLSHPEAGAAVADYLAEKLEDGGCAAVICNRVRHAQDIYEAIKEKGFINDENLILFHARFPFQWRKGIEERVLALFSKSGKRPIKAIVVATQVIEQSLDLDFDFMLTDLAPVDLLLQRAGRLHRHARNDENRPQGLKSPCLSIFQPSVVDTLPDFGLDVKVYDKATLLRTWLVLQNRDHLILPDETSGLIEAVYGNALDSRELQLVYVQALNESDEDARLKQDKKVYEAKKRLIAAPDDEGLINDRNENLEEEDPRVNEAFRALTRDASPSISLICLHETAQGIALETDGTGAPIDIHMHPSLKEARELLKRAVNVQRWDVVNYYSQNVKTSNAWRESAAVRFHYPVIFNRDGEVHPVGVDFTLKLTRELGLQVIKESK